MNDWTCTCKSNYFWCSATYKIVVCTECYRSEPFSYFGPRGITKQSPKVDKSLRNSIHNAMKERENFQKEQAKNLK